MAVDAEILEFVELRWNALLAEVRDRVREARWAPKRASWERPELLLDEREGRVPVEDGLAQAPPDPTGAVRYGYDADRRLIIADRFSAGTPLRLAYTRIWVEVNGAATFVAIAAPGATWEANLMRITQPHYQGDRLIGVDTRVFGRETIDIEERYSFDAAGRVIEIIERQHREAGVTLATYVVTYGPDDRVAMITSVAQVPGGPERSFVNYRRPDADVVRHAARVVTDTLPNRVVAWVNRVAPAEPIVALALLYSRQIPGLPPALAIATESDRARLSARQREEGLPLDVWNPAEWSLLDAEVREFVDDEEFLAASRALLERWRISGSHEPLRELLVRAAKDLRQRPWPQIRLALGELVVFAVDDEQEDLERNLRATTSAALRRRVESATG